MSDEAAPDSSRRKKCYIARDAFYDCVSNSGENSKDCDELKKTYHENCLSSWVKYFDKKRHFDAYKTKLETEGYQETSDSKK